MGKATGFLEIKREQPTRRKVEDRLVDWFEIYNPFPEEKQREQGARCMDCGVPFCHTGCPVNNLIPDWNDLVYNGRWEAPFAASTPPTTSPNSPAASALPRARPPAYWASISRPSPSSSLSAASLSAPGTKDSFNPSLPRKPPAKKLPSSAAALPDWPQHSSYAAPATQSPSTRKTTASAACFATAFPTSKWKSTSSTAASSR